MSDIERAALPIIGRERALVDALAKALTDVIGGPDPSKKTMKQLRLHQAGRGWPTYRGVAFEIMIADPDGQPTGHIARVGIDLVRFERQGVAR